tara:strand:+ start:1398 stop:1820 length:423 start_codon:yes stop_codon:yes gene_type:complete
MRPKIDMSEKIKKVDDCDMWTAGCHMQGYPMMRDPHVKNRMVIVVRWLAEQKLGRKLTRETRVKNNCGNVKCVNLNHYDIVDYDTDIDRWKCTPHFVLPEIREKMRTEYKNTPHYHGIKRDMVKKYNVTHSTLNKILAGN